MIWVITRHAFNSNETYIDCVKATRDKAQEYINRKNYEQWAAKDIRYHYQMYEREIE